MNKIKVWYVDDNGKTRSVVTDVLRENNQMIVLIDERECVVKPNGDGDYCIDKILN